METELYHYGVKGMKWGVRKDHTLQSKHTETTRKGLSDKQKSAMKIGIAAATTALAVYGGYKLAKSGKLESLIDKGKNTADKLLNKTKTISSSINRKDPRTKIDLQFFANKSSSRKTVKLNKREFAHVMSELATNITNEQKTYPTITKAIGDYVYVFENNFDNTYRVIGKKKLSDGMRFLTKGHGKT